MKKLLTTILLVCSVSQASAVPVTAIYINTFVTNQDPVGIGNIFVAHLWLELPSFPAGGLNGTFTFADNLHWASIWTGNGTSDFFASSSMPTHPIDPNSYFTFTDNVVTGWSLIGDIGTAHLESISGVHDYIVEPNGAYAINPDTVGAWRVSGIPVPGPLVGTGLPGLVLFLWWLVAANAKRPHKPVSNGA